MGLPTKRGANAEQSRENEPSKGPEHSLARGGSLERKLIIFDAA